MAATPRAGKVKKKARFTCLGWNLLTASEYDMKPKREVSANLGRTQFKNAARYYAQIGRRIGPYKRCPFYSGSKYSQFNARSHNALNKRYPNPSVPIEEFDFQFDSKKGVWKLQAYCRICYKAYRDARIQKARATWKSGGKEMTDAQIRNWYRRAVGPTMRCSKCKRDLDPNEFPVSRSMEKGLHNECFDCVAGQGTSVREQAWLSEGDWNSWKEAVAAMRKKRHIKCAGWSRAQETGVCACFGDGKHMHADHIVPLRAGGLHDARNFQPLCNVCNTKKSDQIDPHMTLSEIRARVGRKYRSVLKNATVEQNERALKLALIRHLQKLLKAGQYKKAIEAKKREVNGQWNVERAYKKGIAWLEKGGGRLSD